MFDWISKDDVEEVVVAVVAVDVLRSIGLCVDDPPNCASNGSTR